MSYTKSKITKSQNIRFPYWKISDIKTNGVPGYEIHWSEDGECVTDHVYTKEDANLIAAAPALFETLKLLDARGGLGLDNHAIIKSAILLAETGEV